MKRWQTLCAVAVFLAAAIAGSVGRSDDKEKPAEKPAAKSAKEAPRSKGARESKPRLPRYYGKLNLSDSQREKIYGIQSKFETDIEKIEKQLAEMKNRQETECRKVLDADQKKQLADLVDAGKSKTAKDADMEE